MDQPLKADSLLLVVVNNAYLQRYHKHIVTKNFFFRAHMCTYLPTKDLEARFLKFMRAWSLTDFKDVVDYK